MIKVKDSRAGRPVPKYHKVCSKCEGAGMIQSDDGSQAIECPKCEGSRLIKNPFGIRSESLL